jgi:hypothetical protein
MFEASPPDFSWLIGQLRGIEDRLERVRLVRVQLPTDSTPPGNWSPLVSSATRATPETIVPVCRCSLGSGETWAAVRLRGSTAVDWLLVDPVVGGHKPFWLLCQLRTQLRWKARYPVGSAGEVQHCSLHAPAVRAFAELTDDPVQTFRDLLTTDRLHDGLPIFNSGGPLRVRQLAPTESASYVWLDPPAETLFRESPERTVWSLVWQQDAICVPLAILQPRWFAQSARLVHLVPGRPIDVLFE